MKLRALLETLIDIECKVVCTQDDDYKEVLLYSGWENEVLEDMERLDEHLLDKYVYSICIDEESVMIITLDV